MDRQIARNDMKQDTRWIFSRANVLDSPSRKAVEGPLSVEEECQARYYCQELMGYLANKCQIKNEIVASASVYMHRFYQFFPVGGSFNWKDMAVACLFLAAKYEDSPRKLEYILRYWNSYTKATVSAAENETSRLLPDRKIEDAKMQEKVEDLLVLENILLLTLGFDMQIQHAEYDITQTYPQLRLTKDTAFGAYKLAQLWTRFTPLSLLHRPEEIAAACIYYVCRKTKTPLLDEDFKGVETNSNVSSGNRTVMEPSITNTATASAMLNSQSLYAVACMPTNISLNAVGNDLSSVSAEKNDEKPDWLNCFNESVRRFSPETRRPSPVHVTQQVVQNCIEELKFWASKLPPDVQRRLLAVETAHSRQPQQNSSVHAGFPAHSSSKVVDASSQRKPPTSVFPASAGFASAPPAKLDLTATAMPLPYTIVVSHTSPKTTNAVNLPSPVQTVLPQTFDTPKVEYSRPGEAVLVEK